ncbi:MAG: dynamin family protein [Thermodesulfobacteriota bacterium]
MSKNPPPEAFIQGIARLQEMAGEWAHLFPQAASQGEHWLKVLSQVQAHVAEDYLRLAVVGTVKSGKSTLVNALLGQDLLPRGAGILTAMITRVRPGPTPRAQLQFKDWEEIQGEIQRALGLLPSSVLLNRSAPLDLQDSKDRAILAQALAEGRAANLWSQDSLNQDYLLLKSYLEGYPLLTDFLAAGSMVSLDGPAVMRHRQLVTQEATAVYLKDVLLTLPMPWLPQGLELGDCQGSDSPIPQHLAQVLAYILKCDLLLYVISSRVGLRQADFQFISELKRMGLSQDTYFLLNLDLTEHQGLGEVERLKDRVLQELSPIIPNPPLYAFSALKVLLERRQAQRETVDPRETALLNVWAAAPDLASFSDGEWQRFETDLRGLLSYLKDQHLVGGSLSQVQMVARGLREQLEITQGLLGKDLSAFQEMETRLVERRQPLEATRRSLIQSLEGAAADLKKVVGKRISSYLDPHSGQAASLQGFIRGYEPDWERLLPPDTAAPFRQVLYRLFQEFQKELGRYAAGDFNLQALEFIRTQENYLRRGLEETCAPLVLALQEALSLYYREIAALGLAATPPALKLNLPPRPPELELPLLALNLDPGWRWAREVWLRSGMGLLKRTWLKVKGRLGLKTATDPRSQLLKDLSRALAAIKAWLLEQVREILLDYGERLKFRYFFPLLDYWLKKQEADLNDLMGSLLTDLTGVADAVRQEEADRAARRHRLEELVPLAQEIEMSLIGGGGQGSQTPVPSPKPPPPTP